MNAPNLWLQLLIAFLGVASIPAVITILGKIHLLPLAVYLLADYSFPLWASNNPIVSTTLLILSILYPILVWGRQGSSVVAGRTVHKGKAVGNSDTAEHRRGCSCTAGQQLVR